MTGKKFLEDVKYIKTNIKAYQDELLILRIIAYGAPIANYGDIVRNNNSIAKSSEEDYIIKIEECESKIKALTCKYAVHLSFAIELIEKLCANKSKSTLILYYLNNKPEKDCAQEFGITLRQYQNRKKKALEEFEIIYKQYSSQIA